MRTEKEKKREAASRVFMATHSAKEIQKERNRILRKFSFGFTSRIEEDLSDRYIIIRALKDRENLRCGFDIETTANGSEDTTTIKETFMTTRRRFRI